ncbi:MAG TPA: AraC family transcriptional regulator [Rhodocyclaceae bacterium]|nr:AraC family transcriptional regulator [Rhodocyclaceae bacterium]
MSEILKSVRLEGAFYLNAEFTAPWCAQTKFGLSRVVGHLPGAEHVMFFHFLTEGSCKVRLADGGEAFDLTAGDLVVFPHDDTHILGSDLQLTPVEAKTDIAVDELPTDDFLYYRGGGGGETTRFVCGYLACNRSLSRPLLDALPRALHIPMGEGPGAMLMRELLKKGVRESAAAQPGGHSILAKLSELMFVDAMRRYIESLPPGGQGWLAGVRDAQVGKALAMLHAEPSKAWTVDELAAKAALSRSTLAERFTALVGEPPMQYLMRWRLALAAQSLRAGSEAIIRVAERCGYESEAAFSRAFKREFGLPPAAWRKAGQNAT